MSEEVDLDRWIDEWRGPIVGLLAARGLAWPQATELAQEVFAEAWLARARFRGDGGDAGAVGAWCGQARLVEGD